jgi:hypothetical protein
MQRVWNFSIERLRRFLFFYVIFVLLNEFQFLIRYPCQALRLEGVNNFVTTIN